MTADLAAFLHARLDEDEQIVRAAEARTRKFLKGTRPWEQAANVASESWAVLERFQARFATPERVLADIDAKRQIIDKYERALANRRAHPDDLGSAGALLALHGVVKLFALPWRDHPDYRQEWSP